MDLVVLKDACNELATRLLEARDQVDVLKRQGLPGRMKTVVDRTRVLIVSVQQNVAELDRLRVQHVAALDRAAAAEGSALPEGEVVEKAEAAKASGGMEYYLADGRGPFATIQAAMDEMGLPKEQRPRHNRWDRLSGELKKAISPSPRWRRTKA